MGCCIVVALIIGQLLAYRDRIRRLLGMTVDDDAGHDPLPPSGLRLRRALLPAIALAAAGSLAYQHRDHLAGLPWPSALAANSTIAAAVCGTNIKTKETP